MLWQGSCFLQNIVPDHFWISVFYSQAVRLLAAGTRLSQPSGCSARVSSWQLSGYSHLSLVAIKLFYIL